MATSFRIWQAEPRGDGLFANAKFCLSRPGRLALSWRRSPPKPDRLTSLPVTAAVSGGFCPLGADHEAAAVDGDTVLGQPSSGGAAVGSSLSAAPIDASRGSGRCHGRHSGGFTQ